MNESRNEYKEDDGEAWYDKVRYSGKLGVKADWEHDEDIGDAHKDDDESNDSDDDKGEKEETEGIELEKEDRGGRDKGVLAVKQHKSARRGGGNQVISVIGDAV